MDEIWHEKRKRPVERGVPELMPEGDLGHSQDAMSTSGLDEHKDLF